MANSINERRVISVIVLNESSVLARVTSLLQHVDITSPHSQ